MAATYDLALVAQAMGHRQLTGVLPQGGHLAGIAQTVRCHLQILACLNRAIAIVQLLPNCQLHLPAATQHTVIA
ncbi:hypothetical protein PWG14_01690 (plasmid) [Chromobacterium amazonense]|nr:hypothetical protein [Chromobacterium amazonense]MDE1711506.1 hypothetical protein [Chromobacterium amazonense]